MSKHLPVPRPSTNPRPIAGVTSHEGRGQRLRQIIEIALKRRKMLGILGKSKLDPRTEESARRPLEVWMQRNLWPGAETVRRFPLYNDVLIVMPANNEGKKLMLELDELLRN